MDMGPEKYVMFKMGDKSVAGVIDKPIPDPGKARPHWMPYFMVEDIDKACQTA